MLVYSRPLLLCLKFFFERKEKLEKYANELRARAILLVFEKIYTELFH